MSDTGPSIESGEYWDEAAAGWRRRGELLRTYTAPVSSWLVEAIDPRPGQRVLELAAGLGEISLLVAARVAPDGVAVCSDRSEAMLAAARERAAELGVENVEFATLDAEWIDLPVASVDAVICRWGYMLVTHPESALRETRRVLRPGGTLALAVWDAQELNPWSAVPNGVMRERGLMAAPEPGSPGPFALADRQRLRELLEEAGFQEVRIEPLDFEELQPDFGSYWETRLDFSRVLHDAVLSQPEAEIAKIRAEVEARLAPYAAPDGRLAIPARTLVAVASA
jgi:ubiquinone/menaquinone biosynthesis C-methylase UbiE